MDRGSSGRRLLMETDGIGFVNAELKAIRIIRTNGNYNIIKDIEFIEECKKELRVKYKENKELSIYIDYWNLVLYYLRKIVHENEAL